MKRNWFQLEFLAWKLRITKKLKHRHAGTFTLAGTSQIIQRRVTLSLGKVTCKEKAKYFTNVEDVVKVEH